MKAIAVAGPWWYDAQPLRFEQLPLDEAFREIKVVVRACHPADDLTVLDRFLKRLEDRPAYIIPTVLLLKSVGMARYIDRHMEHIKIPPETIRRLQNAPERVRECVQIAAELIAALKAKQVSGVNIATIGWEDKLPQILSAAGV